MCIPKETTVFLLDYIANNEIDVKRKKSQNELKNRYYLKMEDNIQCVTIESVIELQKYEQNDKIIIKRKNIDIYLNHVKYLGDIFLEGEKIWINRLASNFQINAENLKVLKLTHVVNISELVLKLPNIESLTLESTIMKVHMGKKIKELKLLTSTIPENFTDPEVELDNLVLVTDKKIAAIPKTKSLWSNFSYGMRLILVSHISMQAPLPGTNGFICYIDYIHPKLVEFHKSNPVLMYEWKPELLKRLTRLGFYRIRCDTRGLAEINCCKCELFEILQNYDIISKGTQMLFIAKNIQRREGTNISLPTDIISQVFNKITDEKKRTWIAKLLRKNIWEYYSDLKFVGSMKEIDYAVSDGLINTKKAQIEAIHAERLKIDRKFVPQKIFADRITHLTIDSYSKTKAFEAFDFPNLVSLRLENYDSRIETVKFNKEKIKFLWIGKIDLVPSKNLGISKDCIDLSLYPNLVRFTLDGTAGKDMRINNPKNVIISIWYGQLHLVSNLETPIILRYINEFNIEKIPELKKYNIIKLVLKTTIYHSPAKILDALKKNGMKTKVTIALSVSCKHEEDINILSTSFIRKKSQRMYPHVQFAVK
jgi:hypothetical protein